MSTKQVQPTLGSKSFTCPNCGALAHQTWSELFGRAYPKNQEPFIPADGVIETIKANRELKAESRERLIEYFQNRLLGKPFFEYEETGVFLNYKLENCYISKCFSCDDLAVWVYDQIIFPATSIAVEPNQDLNDEIKLDYNEAAKIAPASSRGAAALLRLCIQKICIQLGLPGKNINDDISTLVRRGLEAQIQQALDIVRVIGNDAVHPGQIDLKDNREIAIKLFTLVNIIAEAMISRPKQIQELYGNLPPAKLEQIEKRDAPKKIEPPAKADS